MSCRMNSAVTAWGPTIGGRCFVPLHSGTETAIVRRLPIRNLTRLAVERKGVEAKECNPNRRRIIHQFKMSATDELTISDDRCLTSRKPCWLGRLFLKWLNNLGRQRVGSACGFEPSVEWNDWNEPSAAFSPSVVKKGMVSSNILLKGRRHAQSDRSSRSRNWAFRCSILS